MEITEDSLFEIFESINAPEEKKKILSIKELRRYADVAWYEGEHYTKEKPEDFMANTASPDEVYSFVQDNKELGLCLSKPGEVEKKIEQIFKKYSINKSVEDLKKDYSQTIDIYNDDYTDELAWFAVEGAESIDEFLAGMKGFDDQLKAKNLWWKVYEQIGELNEDGTVPEWFNKYEHRIEGGQIFRTDEKCDEIYNKIISFSKDMLTISDLSLINEIPHIPDDQELSVEEINAFCKKFGFQNNSIDQEKDVVSIGVKDCDFILNPEGINSFNTKEKLFEIIKDVLDDFNDSKWAEAVKISQVLNNAVDNFDQKFDKCMAEFHAKFDKPNTKHKSPIQRAKSVSRSNTTKNRNLNKDER